MRKSGDEVQAIAIDETVSRVSGKLGSVYFCFLEGWLAVGNDDADDGMRGVLDSDRLVAWLWPGAALP